MMAAMIRGMSKVKNIGRAVMSVPISPMTIRPIDQVFQLVERSSQSLREEIWNMQKSLFALEPIAAMDAMMANMLRSMAALKHHEEHHQLECTQSGLLDSSNDFFEVGQDGKMYFKAYFNAKDFKPEDISIHTDKNKLIIKARRSVKKGNGLMEEFVGRSIPLPLSVNTTNLKATLTSDDVLVIEAPIDESKCKSSEGLAIQPSAVEKRQIALNNKDGVEIVTSDDGSRKMHLELSVDECFTANDVKVWVKGDKVYVSGRVAKEEKTEKSICSESRDFCRMFTTPKAVDIHKAKAELMGGRLVVEAPLLP